MTADDPIHRALEAQRDLVCEWSPGGTILFSNRAYREFFGFSDLVTGRNLDEFVDWDDGDDRDALLARLRGGESTVMVARHYADGRAVEWSNTLVCGDDGDPISVLAIGRVVAG